MNQSTELVPVSREEMPLAKPAESVSSVTVVGMIQTAVQSGITAENAAALEKLVGLCERMQDRESERAFAGAFAALQEDLSRVSIQPTKAIPMKGGGTKFKYAPFEEIMGKVQPYLIKHKFAVSFSSCYDGPRIIVGCTLQHVAGHKRDFEFAARVGQGPVGANECQADGAASTYAKRFAFCQALNIVIDTDSDGRSEGPTETITQDEADILRKLVAETGSDERSLLEYAGVVEYAKIPAHRYQELYKILAKRRSTR